ncbi:MAG: HEAT repeat domain-containing protein [Chloroflexi bacterium]|nr:HEAT repeat domain-containing protein [Chloroflexota bacterium]
MTWSTRPASAERAAATMKGFEKELAALERQKPSLDEVIAALQAGAATRQAVLSSTIVYGLSDLSPAEGEEIAASWSRLPVAFKAQVLRGLNDASESLFELNFRAIAHLCLSDSSSPVRAAAIDLLWFDESPETMQRFMQLADDEDGSVRASALTGLGRFLLLGEYGGIAADQAGAAQQIALRLHSDEQQPVSVRRRALEALANSSHPQVEGLIRAAYAQGSHEMKIGAIFAMGRTCNPIWGDALLEELASEDQESIYEAIAACGQLGLKQALPRIGALAQSNDGEIQLAAIAALGEIGGRRALDLLSELAEAADDDDVAEAIDVALDGAAFSFGLSAPVGVYGDG